MARGHAGRWYTGGGRRSRAAAAAVCPHDEPRGWIGNVLGIVVILKTKPCTTGVLDLQPRPAVLHASP